jgi:hypothetical protein
VGCERRKSRLCRGEEERAEAFFLRERRRTRQIHSRDARAASAPKTSVGPSKYELQGPTVWPELSDVSS